MHILRVRQPRPALRAFVRTFVERKIDATTNLIQPTTAQLEQILTFDFGTPVECWWPDGHIQKIEATSVAGAQTHFACNLRLLAGAHSFGIFFQPTGFTALFAVPICELTNRQIEATPLLGPTIRSLWNRLGECLSFEQRVLVAEEFLLHQFTRRQELNTIAAAADYIFCSHGVIRISKVCHHVSVGLRQFERKFREEIGATPKAFARIARFQAALDAKITTPERTWLDIAHTFGYHDQMHMIHDFNILGRNSPSSLLENIGDSRPPALVLNASEAAPLQLDPSSHGHS
jgi:AraC-like DNA-binding protein